MYLIGMHFSFGLFLGSPVGVFLGTPPLTGTLEGTDGGVAVLNISARDINVSLCGFLNFSSGLAGAGFCSA